MYFSVPEQQAYRDFTRNGLTFRDTSPYPSNSANEKRWRKAMREMEKKIEANNLGPRV